MKEVSPPASATGLRDTARWLVREGRGILAADERTATLTKRFDAVGIPSTPETRHAYREMLFGAEGIGDSLSGVILFDETICQSTANGVPFPEHLAAQGVLSGIKVDGGAHPLAGFPGETVTEGLDGLRQRLGEYGLWAHDSRSGVQSLPSPLSCPRRRVCWPTRTPWRATPRSVRRLG
jgi:fructose-bisphosphate aldolase class 1